MPRTRAPQQEKPLPGEAQAPQRRVALLATIRESTCAAMKTQHSQKERKKKKKDSVIDCLELM